MIQKVNGIGSFASNLKEKTQNSAKNILIKTGIKDYSDSFIKQSKKSLPVLAGLTATWTILDKTLQNVPLRQALKQNVTRFFIPVLLVSSALLAGIETKK